MLITAGQWIKRGQPTDKTSRERKAGVRRKERIKESKKPVSPANLEPGPPS